jgi:hypothetical protein
MVQARGEQAGRIGQACPVRLGGTSDVDLRVKHRDFVAGDQDFNVLGCGAAGEQLRLAEHRARGQIQQSEQHGRDHVVITVCNEAPAYRVDDEFRHGMGQSGGTIEPVCPSRGSRACSQDLRCWQLTRLYWSHRYVAGDVAPGVMTGVAQDGNRVFHETLALKPCGQLGTLLCALIY